MRNPFPSCSVVIPTHERPETLRRCLRAISRLEIAPSRFEVIVVDDASPTSPEPVVAEFRDKLTIRLLVQEKRGPGAARNAAAAVASGEVIAFTDDDCAPEPTWLAHLAARWSENPQTIVGGRTVNQLTDDGFATASQLLVDYLYAYHDQRGQSGFFTSNNMAVSAELFRKVGGFDERLRQAGGEDREFCDRWAHHGMRLVYAPEAIVHHTHSMSFRGFWRQHFNYGRGAYHYHAVRAERTRDPIKLEPLKFYADLVAFPFRQKCPNAGRLAALMAVSQAANAAGFFSLARPLHKNGARKPAKIPTE